MSDEKKEQIKQRGLRMLRAKQGSLLPACKNCGCRRYSKCGCQKKGDNK